MSPSDMSAAAKSTADSMDVSVIAPSDAMASFVAAPRSTVGQAIGSLPGITMPPQVANLTPPKLVVEPSGCVKTKSNGSSPC